MLRSGVRGYQAGRTLREEARALPRRATSGGVFSGPGARRERARPRPVAFRGALVPNGDAPKVNGWESSRTKNGEVLRWAYMAATSSGVTRLSLASGIVLKWRTVWDLSEKMKMKVVLELGIFGVSRVCDFQHNCEREKGAGFL